MKESDEKKRELSEKFESSKAELCLLKGKVSTLTEMRNVFPGEIHTKQNDSASAILTEMKK